MSAPQGRVLCVEAMASILRRLCFVDIETTGLDPSSEEIIEIGAVFVERGVVIDRKRWLVKPNRPIPALITALTGLTDEEVASAPPLGSIDDELRAALGGWTLVAHNAGFERSFLGERIAQNPMLDSCEVAQLLFPERASHSLDSLVRWLELGRAARHRALDDAEDTFLVLAALCDRVLQEPHHDRLDRLLFQLEGGTSTAMSSLFESLRTAPAPLRAESSQPPPRASTGIVGSTRSAKQPISEEGARLAGHLARWLEAPTFVAAELEREELITIAFEAGTKVALQNNEPVAIAVSGTTFRELRDFPALPRRAVCSTALSRGLGERGTDELGRFSRAYLSSWLARTRTGDLESVSGFVRSRCPEVMPLLEAATVCQCDDPACFSKRALGDAPCMVISHEHALDWLERGAPISIVFLEGDRLPEVERRRSQRSLELWQLERFGGLEAHLAELAPALAAFAPGVVLMRARVTPEWHAIREAMKSLSHTLRAAPFGEERSRLLGRIVEVLEPPPPGFEVYASPTGLVRAPIQPAERVRRRLGRGHCLISSFKGGLSWTRASPVAVPTDKPSSQLEWMAEPTSLDRLAQLVAGAAPVVLVAASPLAPIAEACQRLGLTISLDASRPSAVQLCEWRRDRPMPAGHTCVFYGVREWRRAVLSSNAQRVMLLSPTGLALEPISRALQGLEPRLLSS
jgi:DNA polymerase III epsilon subunit family exonuclease